ncbi:MAG: hypothetical protein QOD63_1495 [Actinomycetota bacterium]|jgi:hypothetical protein|nr:hypothetical protein [Actinomycetota bacterium]
MPGLRDIPGVHIHRSHIAGQATAGTADEFASIRVPYNATLVAAYWIPKAAVTADATNYATVNVRNRGAAGAGTAVAATRSYAAVNSVAFVAEAMTLSATAANLLFAAGDTISVEKLNTGTGLALPPGSLELHLQYR